MSDMKSQDRWAKRLMVRLEAAGFKVTMVDPSLAPARKKAGRKRDQRLISSGKASRLKIQRKNSLFGNCAR